MTMLYCQSVGLVPSKMLHLAPIVFQANLLKHEYYCYSFHLLKKTMKLILELFPAILKKKLYLMFIQLEK